MKVFGSGEEGDKCACAHVRWLNVCMAADVSICGKMAAERL